MNQDNRYLRQQQIIPADKLAAVKATVVGVGAIGRQVGLQLAANAANVHSIRCRRPCRR